MIFIVYFQLKYSQSSRKRPPREFKQVVVTRAGHLREWAFVSIPHAQTIYWLATYEMYESECTGQAKLLLFR